MKKIVFTLALFSFLSYGCGGSKAEKAAENVKKASEKLIDDLNNATSEEEVNQSIKEFKEKRKFERSKLTDEEVEEYNKNQTWEEHQEQKEYERKHNEAIRNAKNRFR